MECDNSLIRLWISGRWYKCNSLLILKLFRKDLITEARLPAEAVIFPPIVTPKTALRPSLSAIE